MTEQELTARAEQYRTWSLSYALVMSEVQELAEGYLALLAERDALRADKTDQSQWHKDWLEAVRELKRVQAERDALKAELEDTGVWMRDAERVASGRVCSCWLGTSSTFGSSEARRACAVHGDEAGQP